MILGFSRHIYIELVDRCTLTSFMDCHKHAFGFFGGIPADILYDNMKNVVIKNLIGRVEFNKTFTDFALHYAFKPVACPPYSPWYKGKVERPFQYLRERFWRGYSFINIHQANKDIRQWTIEVAMQRIHGTTKQKVADRFVHDSQALGPLPQRPYDTSEKVYRKVYKDCVVSFDANRYVVPHKYVNKQVLLKVKGGVVRIYHDDELLVVYRIPQGKGNFIAEPRFYEALKADREQVRRKYQSPPGKGKATRGLVSNGLRYETVERRDLSCYEILAGGAICRN